MSYLYQAPKHFTGNRCGHVPQAPRFYVRTGKKTYGSIHMALQNLPEYYKNPTTYLDSIRHMRFNCSKHDVRCVWAKSKQRTESREAVSAVAAFFINHCDFATLKCVKFRNGKPEAVSLLDAATVLNMSYERVYRTTKVLQQAGYLIMDSKPKKFYRYGKAVFITAIKYLSRKFFQELGVSHMRLEREINFALTKGEKRSSKQKKNTSFPRKRSFPKTIGQIVSQLADRAIIPPKAVSIAAATRVLQKFKT